MKVTLTPETYSADPFSVSVPIGRDEEQKLMSLAGTAQIAQALKGIWDAFTKKKVE